jgi:hypothetical protein
VVLILINFDLKLADNLLSLFKFSQHDKQNQLLLTDIIGVKFVSHPLLQGILLIIAIILFP